MKDHLLVIVTHDIELPEYVHAVLAHGCPQWYELGLELGFTDAEVNEYAQNTAEGSGKLLVLLEKKTNEVSPEGLILNACQLENSYGRVQDEVNRIVAGKVHTET